MFFQTAPSGPLFRTCMPAALLLVAGALSGCSGGFNAVAPAAEPAANVAVTGRAMGGQQPIADAQIVLFNPGTSGYGSPALSLMTSTVTTTNKGNFTLTGNFACSASAPAAPVYLAVLGGNPGLAQGTNNAGIVLMSLIGPCNQITNSSFFSVNELTTIAAIYALAPFMQDYAHIGTTAANQAGLATAFATAASLVSNAGKSPGAAPAIATVPSTELNTLANVLSTCVNSNGSTAAGTPCSQLYTAARPPEGVMPADISQALLDIVRNPANNATAVFNVAVPSGPFQPVLSAAPADWTVGIQYSAPAFRAPSDLAVDGQGQVWVAAAPGTLGNGSSTISTLTTAGLAGIYPQQYQAYGNLAIDTFGQVWLANSTASNLVVLSSSGTRQNPVAYTGGGLSGPGAMAFDPSGHLWVANSSAALSEFSVSGQPLSGANGYATGGSPGPVALASDMHGTIWTANFSANAITATTAAGQTAAGSPFTGDGLSEPFAVALDSTGQVYAANLKTSTVTRMPGAGTGSIGLLRGAALTGPAAMVIDGDSSAWLANSSASTVSVFTSASTTPVAEPYGYGAASLLNPVKLAVDGAGNVWVANQGTNVAGSGMITQLVGAAAPVITPLASAVAQGKLATRP